MKILRLSYEWPPPWIGLTPAPFELTRAQARLGHKVTVICGRWPGSGPIEKVDGVSLIPLFREPVRGTMLVTVALTMSLYAVFWRLSNKCDIYHIHGHAGLFFYLYKLLFGFLDKTPVVTHFHICSRARWDKAKNEGKRISFMSRYLEWPLATLSEYLAVKVSDALIFVGDDVKSDIMKFYNPGTSVCSVVESGVNPELFFKKGDDEVRIIKNELGFGEGDVVISNIGFLVERKNIHLIIEALEFLPVNYKLMLVGKGSNSYEERLRKLASRRGLSKRVLFLGERKYPETPNFYNASDIFVLPSSYEGFPKAVLEALACGIPVVASGFDHPQIQGLEAIDILEPKNLAEEIMKTRLLRGKVDVAKVVEKYSWLQRAKEIDTIYSNLLS